MKNEILIKYKVNQKENIFGFDFVENNKQICKYIYEDKEYELTDEFDLIEKF